ncbi:MAG TPA: DUF4199 domain-containing protein, partial [Longimicrobiaceae bacterium]|nr:DUF4199 domain-containing protein [Longimicrobiaceae bacterium]
MKKIVWTFGLISGVLLSAMMFASITLVDRLGMDHSMVLGYTTMVLAFLLVYFGIRSYRDNVGGGSVGFGRAFSVGMLIMLISSACYVATWEVMYFKMMPDFLDKYTAQVLAKAKAAGASQQELDRQAREMAEFKEQYKNPLVNVAYTLMEPLPVGIVMTLASAAMLSRRRRHDVQLNGERA